jgi:hypothetical protein
MDWKVEVSIPAANPKTRVVSQKWRRGIRPLKLNRSSVHFIVIPPND